MRPSPGLQPATRTVAGFRLTFFGPPCIHEAHFRHRGASVSGLLRPSATVAAWHPGPAAPFRGKASIPPGFHPCPENAPPPLFAYSPASTARLRPAPIRITPHHSHLAHTAKRSSHRTRSVGQRSLPKNVPSCDFQLSGLWPGRLRRLSR